MGTLIKAIPHNSKCRYGERGAADAKPKAQIILDAAKVSAASGGNSEPKQGQRSQSARGFCPRSTMRVPQPDIIEHFGNADAVPQLPERCLSRKAGIVRCCLNIVIPFWLLSPLFISSRSSPPSRTGWQDPVGAGGHHGREQCPGQHHPMAICPSICRVPGIIALGWGCLLLISPIPTTNTVPPGSLLLAARCLLYQAIVGLLFLFGKLSAHGPQPIQCGSGKGGVHHQAEQLVPGGDKVICPAGQGAGGVQGNALRK